LEAGPRHPVLLRNRGTMHEDGDFDYRVHVSMEDWTVVDDWFVKRDEGTEYRIQIPDIPICDECRIVIENGKSAWLKAVWNHGNQTGNWIWCPPCYSKIHPMYVAPKSKPSLLSRIKKWLYS